MKKQILALPRLAVVTGLALAAGLAAEAQSTPSKIGVIEIQTAIVSTKDGQKAAAELNTKLEPRKKELDQKAAEIRDLQDRLQRGGDKMADAAKQDLARNIDAKTKIYNRDMEDARAEAEEEQRRLLQELSGKMMQVIDKYAQANGFSIILDVSNPNTPVMFASNTVNITKDIIDQYDQANPGAPAAPAKPAAQAAPQAAPVKPAPAPAKKP
ncbi:MAG TPA: OmpH family outer membrane protein [Bryobacteraceae bacterium]|nr:OmpH family outer membrane protein [Bryobacteraceae bacterium]